MRISDWSSDVCSSDLVLTALPEKFKASWLFDELDRSRRFGAAIHKFGALIGGTINWIEQNIFGGKQPWSIRALKRSEERRVGNDGVSQCRSRGAPHHRKKKKHQ